MDVCIRAGLDQTGLRDERDDAFQQQVEHVLNEGDDYYFASRNANFD